MVNQSNSSLDVTPLPQKISSPQRLAAASLVALGAICFAARPAQAQTEACSYVQPGHATSNTYDVPFVDNQYLYLFNDVFAARGGGSQNVCDLETTSNSWNSTWNWPTAGGVVSYPCAQIGWSFGDPPRNQNPNVTNLPVLISDAHQIPTSATFTLSGTNQYDVAYDLYFSPMKDPGASGDPTAEIMVWLNSGHLDPSTGQPDGQQIPGGVLLESNLSFSGQPGTYDLYCEMGGSPHAGQTCANQSQFTNPASWPEYVFLSKSNVTSYSADLGRFIYHVANYKQLIPTSDYLITAAFGVEVRYNTSPTGSLNVSQYSISVD